MSSKNIQSEGTEGKDVGQIIHQSKRQPIHWVTETGVAPAGGQYPSQSYQVKGQRAGDHFFACSRNFVPSASFLGLLLCFLCCVRPHDICHLFSVKFSCKVSQCVVPEKQHVKFSGCSQTEFSRFIYVLVSQEGSGSL